MKLIIENRGLMQTDKLTVTSHLEFYDLEDDDDRHDLCNLIKSTIEEIGHAIEDEDEL